MNRSAHQASCRQPGLQKCWSRLLALNCRRQVPQVRPGNPPDLGPFASPEALTQGFRPVLRPMAALLVLSIKLPVFITMVIALLMGRQHPLRVLGLPLRLDLGHDLGP